jgi:hypothetical protein
MIKTRFFNEIDSIALEDIWVYRLLQGRHENKINQSLRKYSYDPVKYHDIPLFNKKVQMTFNDDSYRGRWNN